jgi:hypothetical protein
MQVSKAIAHACAAAVLAAVLPMGCGPSTTGPESHAQLSIAQVGQIFHVYQKREKSPPQGVKDLQSLQNVFPAAVSSIRSKDVLVFWGVGISDGPEAASTVLAYHKDVPDAGGEVLMQDGTAKKMTAAEFQAAKKPPGATTEGATAPAPSKKRK